MLTTQDTPSGSAASNCPQNDGSGVGEKFALMVDQTIDVAVLERRVLEFCASRTEFQVVLYVLGRGCVLANEHDDLANLRKSLSRVQGYPKIGTFIIDETNFGCCLGVMPAYVPSRGDGFELLFDIGNPMLPSRMIAERAREKLREVKDQCAGMCLRWANGATVLVDQFDEPEHASSNRLLFAVQRARRFTARNLDPVD